jgi:hypothetical protein
VSGRMNAAAAAHVVVRCSRVSKDRTCGREQAIESCDDGIGVRVASAVSDAIADWLSSFGWRNQDGRWLCPFCAVSGDPS